MQASSAAATRGPRMLPPTASPRSSSLGRPLSRGSGGLAAPHLRPGTHLHSHATLAQPEIFGPRVRSASGVLYLGQNHTANLLRRYGFAQVDFGVLLMFSPGPIANLLRRIGVILKGAGILGRMALLIIEVRWLRFYSVLDLIGFVLKGAGILDRLARLIIEVRWLRIYSVLASLPKLIWLLNVPASLVDWRC